MSSTLRTRTVLFIIAIGLTLNCNAFAVPMLEDSNFDQIAKIVEFGGTATQIGGGDPGKNLLTEADFVGPVDHLSGVDVLFPGALFALTAETAAGPNEPGNDAPVLLGPPTDMTFTAPGPGGPDGTDGDGAFKLNPGELATFTFGDILTAESLLIFTNTANSGTAFIEFLLDDVATGNVSTVIPANTSGSGLGGAQIGLAGLAFQSVQITALNGALELDAIAAFNATPVPEPGSLILLGTGVFGAGLALRRRLNRTGKTAG